MSSENIPGPQEFISLNKVNFTHQDIFSVVDDFYSRIQKDPILKVPFETVEDWPEHVKRLTHFWWIKFGGRPYMKAEYNPPQKHFLAGFNEQLLSRWLSIFHDTLQTHLTLEQSELWKQISNRMGDALTMKNEILKEQFNIK